MVNLQSRKLAERTRWHLGLAALLAVSAPAVAGANGLKPSTGTPSEIASMLPGDQLVLSGQSAAIAFAGRTVSLEGFTGIIGYASDVAYIATISGNVSAVGKTAKHGRILLLPPFGEAPSVALFDAGRMAASWGEADRTEFAAVHAELQAIARSQARGIFLGSLGRTSFNVAASGDASQELARRSVVGGGVAQSIRFSEQADKGDYERAVVTRFAQALASGDAATVAQLMDPLPFGLSDMRGAPGDARTVAAEHLAFERDWAGLLGAAAPQYDPATETWAIAGTSPVSITLRKAQNMPFIKSIRIGG